MILQPCNVELTKIHYYDKTKRASNLEISTISREVCENNFNRNVIIKKNVFGHRWVLKINEDEGEVKEKSKLKVVVYVLVFCSIVVAVCFGIFFSIDKKILATTDHKIVELTSVNDSTKNTYFYKTHENQLQATGNTPNEKYITTTKTNITSSRMTQAATFCGECTPSQAVCLKLQETEQPRCVQILDKNDPTGCGGWCRINTHFCQTLDSKHKVYQCSPLRNTLTCPRDNFNCGNWCVSQEKRCDGTIHCSNHSDEENCACNLDTHFHCGNLTSCLEKSKKCDRKVDCWDQSDEINCDKASNCTENEMQCFDGRCIPRDWFCNGNFDCLDKSDEPEGCQT